MEEEIPSHEGRVPPALHPCPVAGEPLCRPPGKPAHAARPRLHPRPLAFRHHIRTQCLLLRQTVRLLHDLPDRVSPSHDVRPALFQEKHELAHARPPSHGQYGTGRRPAPGRRVRPLQHVPLHLLQFLVLPQVHHGVRRQIPHLRANHAGRAAIVGRSLPQAHQNLPLEHRGHPFPFQEPAPHGPGARVGAYVPQRQVHLPHAQSLHRVREHPFLLHQHHTAPQARSLHRCPD